MVMDYYVIDVFTDKLIKGNPAGVCLLEHWIDRGELDCEYLGERVLIGGKAVLYSKGNININNGENAQNGEKQVI